MATWSACAHQPSTGRYAWGKRGCTRGALQCGQAGDMRAFPDIAGPASLVLLCHIYDPLQQYGLCRSCCVSGCQFEAVACSQAS